MDKQYFLPAKAKVPVAFTSSLLVVLAMDLSIKVE
jgi:hypothetical protein